MGKYQFLVRSI